MGWMKKQVVELEKYIIYNIRFLVESEFIRQIEKNIVCPADYNHQDVEELIYQKFNRVKEVIKINKLEECTKLDSKIELVGDVG